MEDVPQPSSTPYEVGNVVRIYVGEDDPDARFHGVECEVIEVLEDDLGEETGRNLDAISYRLRQADSGEELPLMMRHRDIISAEQL